jgi:hypothetical protein
MVEQVKKEEVKAEGAVATPAETPKKKSNTTLIIILVLVGLLVVLPAIGVGIFSFFVGSKIKSATNDLNNGKLNIKTSEGTVSLNTNENQTWPTSAPSVVPKFTVGKISNSTRFGDVWTITVTGVTPTDLSAYRAKLAAAGWTLDEEANVDGLVSLGAKSGSYRVTALLTTAEKSMIIGITKESAETAN